MKKIISISETLKIAADQEPVRANADAAYDEANGDLYVQLRLSESNCGSETVKTKVSLADATSAARDIFHSWIHKLVKQGMVSIEE